ncbi:MAG: PD-(D/E)XK nuclease family protein [Bacillales bacterium]
MKHQESLNNESINYFDFTKFNNSLIILPNYLKDYFFYIKNNNPYLNFKFITKSELLTQFIKINKNKVIKELMDINNKNLSYYNSKKIVNYIQRGFNFKEQYNFLDNDELIFYKKNSFIYYNDIYIIDYLENDNEINYCLNLLKYKNKEYIKSSNFIKENNKKEIYHFKNINSEIITLFNYIINEVNNNDNTYLDDFVILTLSNDYDFILKIYSKLFNIKVKFDNEDCSYYSLPIVNELFKLNEEELKKYFENLNYDNNQNEQLLSIKELFDYYDLKNKNNIHSNLKDILLDIKLEKKEYNCLQVSHKINFDPTKKYCVIGCSQNISNKVIKDNDYFSDEYKYKNNLITSEIENFYYKNSLSIFINSCLVKYLSFYKTCEDDQVLKNINFKKEDIKDSKFLINKYNYTYSSFASLLDYKYSIYYKKLYKKTPLQLKYYQISKLNLPNEFNNKFKVFKIDNFNKPVISASNLLTFVKCPFRYYLDNILKVGVTKENIDLKIGNFVHNILEHVYEKDIEFDRLWNKYYQDETFTKEEEFIFNYIIKDRLNIVFNQIRKRIIKNSNVRYIKHEENINLKYDNEYKLIGKIDSIIEFKSSYTIIDYKTGTPVFNIKEFFKIGNYLQLPFYYYLVNKSNKFNKSLMGIYLQPIFPELSLNNMDNYYNQLKLVGLSNDNKNIIDEFEHIDEGEYSNYISKLKLNKNGSFYSKSGIFTSQDLDNMNDKIEEIINNFIKQVNNFNFEISPYKFGGEDSKDTGCAYCQYKNICYIKDNQFRLIKKDKDE